MRAMSLALRHELVGLGGVYAEVLADVAVTLAPVDPGEAQELLLSLRCAELLTGARGRPPVDVSAAAQAASTSGPTQSARNFTGRASSSCTLSATGLRLYFALRSPSGRPRWLIRMTDAP